MNGHVLRVPRRLLVTLRLGEMPEHIPSWRAITHHEAAPAESRFGVKPPASLAFAPKASASDSCSEDRH